LLFNESIKQNILFGDQSASDQRIREVSIQANALPFIMQSDDDFNSKQVQARVSKDYQKEVYRITTVHGSYPKLSHMTKLVTGK
jgi:hypothetical protein